MTTTHSRTGVDYSTQAIGPSRLARFDPNDIHGTRPAVGRYLDALKELGLDDPTGAAEPYGQARALYFTRPVERLVLNEAQVAAQLAAGVITPEDAALTITEAAVVSTTREQQATQQRVLEQAATQANREAARRVRAVGDGLIVDLLRPEVEKCLANPIDPTTATRWDKLHALAQSLRKSGLVPECGGSLLEHTFGDPYAVHLHRLAHADRVKTRHGQFNQATNVRWLCQVPVGAKPLTVITAAQHPEWKPGLYTADEVLANIDKVAAKLYGAEFGRTPPDAA